MHAEGESISRAASAPRGGIRWRIENADNSRQVIARDPLSVPEAVCQHDSAVRMRAATGAVESLARVRVGERKFTFARESSDASASGA